MKAPFRDDELQSLRPARQASRPRRTTLLLRRLRAAVEGALGRALNYEELSTLIGEPKSTFGNWLNGDGDPSAEALLSLLELVPEQNRHEIMDKPLICRVYPRLEHPWLAHDPVAVSRLRGVVATSRGLTVIRGEQETLLTFLITSLGHAALTLTSPRRTVLGLDFHEPDWFVGVPGMIYLPNETRSSAIQEELERFWPKVAAFKDALILLNGTFAMTSVIMERVNAIAGNSHIVLAQRLRLQGQQVPFQVTPSCLVTVGVLRATSERISLEIQCVE